MCGVEKVNTINEPKGSGSDALRCACCRWDYINVDEILSSDRLVNNYVKCLLDKGPCTPDGTELKSEC
jgi:hypothetical protein